MQGVISNYQTVLTTIIMLYYIYDFGCEVRVFENRLKPLHAHDPFKAKVYVLWKLIQKSYLKLLLPVGMMSVMLYSGTLSLVLAMNVILLLLSTHLFYWYRSSEWVFWGLSALLVVVVALNKQVVLYLFPVLVMGTWGYYWR